MAELEFVVEAPEAGRVLAFPSKAFVIGSEDGCQLCLKSALVEPRHAEIVKDTRGEWWVRDLTGSGAVAVNGSPVIDERLSPGDKLRVGDVVMLVRDSGVNAHARTRSGDAMPMVGQSDELQPETVIDNRYRILKRLATGGMGEVYRAVHVELDKPLALKVMLPELSRDPDFVGRFKREAIASSRIGQQNIIDISDFGQTPDGRFYFVMEYVDGKTLIYHRKQGPFPFQRVVHVGLQAARALMAAHAVNIVHRDLKPENIMLVQRPGQPDFVKVLDFGIAKVINATGKSGAFTAIGSVVGTPQYMAPEQASAMAVDPRSDIYSLGLILHELICGKPTFTGDSAVELMSKQLDAPPPPLTSPFGDVPRALDRIVMQMLQKLPEQRPASMEAVIAALEAVASFPTPTARTEPVRSQVRPAPLKLSPELAPATETVAPVAPTMAEAQSTRLIPGVAPVTYSPPAATDDSAAELAAVKPNRTPLLVGGLGLIVVVLIAAVVMTNKPSEPVPVAPAAVVEVLKPAPVVVVEKPAAAGVKLAIESVPERAEIYEEDILLGSTPLTITRPVGTTTSLRCESKGFTALTRKVRFEADTALRFELQKEAVKPTGKRPRPPQPGDDDLKDLPL